MSKLTKNPEKSRTGMAVTGPTNVATWSETGRGHEECSREEAEDTPPTQVTPRTSPVVGKEDSQRARVFLDWPRPGWWLRIECPLAGPEANLLKRDPKTPVEEED